MSFGAGSSWLAPRAVSSIAILRVGIATPTSKTSPQVASPAKHTSGWSTDARTSSRMRAVHRVGTAPERLVGKILGAQGVRFRTTNSHLPGTPDLWNKTRRWAIFVHGCFWHQHPGCRRSTVPTRNRERWRHKFRATKRRDRLAVAALRAGGFATLTIWECELSHTNALEARLRRFMLSNRFRS